MSTHSRRTFLTGVGSAAAAAAGMAMAPGCRAARKGNIEVPGHRPNILLLFPDQHRGDWVGTNGEIAVRTPNLDALAARGVRFTQAVCPSPVCAPSRACLAAGKEYDRCRVPSNGTNYPLDQPTLYQMLRDAGYQVAGCGKFDLHKASKNWGTDGRHLLKEWGFTGGIDSAGKWDAISSGSKEPKDPYMAFLKAEGLLQAHVADMQKRRGNRMAAFPTTLPEHAYGDNWVGANGLGLLEGFAADRPWFLQVNFPGPHDPWDVTERMDKGCRDLKTFPRPTGQETLSPQHLAVRQNYSAMVENIDRWTGIYVTELKRRGELDRTLIIYSSDHGEMLGDHAMWGKSKPHHPSVRVPLVVAGPMVKSGRVENGPATTLDLTATFLDWACVSVPGRMESRSLRPVLDGTGGGREHVLSGLGPWRIVFDGRFKLVTGWRGGRKRTKKGERAAAEPILWDLKNAPLETENVAGKFPEDVERLGAVLRKT